LELKQGDVFNLTETSFLGSELRSDQLGIVVNDGHSWRASKRGCYILLHKQPDGSYIIGSIIKEQGPAVAYGTNKNILKLLEKDEICKGDILYGLTRQGWKTPLCSG
jgi:hypothetical protein